MKLNKKSIATILILIFFGGISVANILGFWKTESSKIPTTYKEGEFKGQYNPADIRGSYSFNDISNNFNIPLDILAKAFNVDEKIALTFKNKDLETKYEGLENEIGTGSVKVFVALYKGLPYNLEAEDTYLPQAAVDILKETNTLTDQQIKYIDSHTVQIPGDVDNGNNNVSTSTDAHSEEDEEFLIKGKTTFNDLINWGILEEDIEEIIGGKIPSVNIIIRDYCVEKGIEFSTVKEKLQEKVDSIK